MCRLTVPPRVGRDLWNLEDFSGINVEENVSNELNKVNSWLSLNKLSLNPDKTEYMTSYTAEKHCPINILNKWEKIENVKFFKL